MPTDCLFCKIVNRQLASPLIYEDEHVLAFNDIEPQAPVHQLIIPKQHISTLDELTPEHASLLGHMVITAKTLAKSAALEAGYRILMNCNADGGQTVFHIHLHLLGGRKMAWPSRLKPLTFATKPPKCHPKPHRLSVILPKISNGSMAQ